MAVLYFVYSCAFTVESQPLVNQNFTNQMQVVAYTVSEIVISIVVHSNQFKAFGFVNLTKKKAPIYQFNRFKPEQYCHCAQTVNTENS